MPYKLINTSGQPIEIRLVKRNNSAVNLRNNILPDGAVNNDTEFSFKLGIGAGYEHIVIGHSASPNIVNPNDYVSNGELYTIVDGVSTDTRIITGTIRLTDNDPNYISKKIGVFYKIRAEDSLFVLGDKPNSPAPVTYQVSRNGNIINLTINDILATKGSYFTDDHYYVPLFYGTLKDLEGVWLSGGDNAITFTPHWTLGANIVQQSVAVVKIISMTGLSITNTDADVTQNTDVVVGLTVTPANADILSTTFTSSNIALASFSDPSSGLMHIHGNGEFSVSATVLDEAGIQLEVIKYFYGLPIANPLTLNVSTTADTRKVSFNMIAENPTTIVVDWGDGNRVLMNDTVGGVITHTYATDSSYQVKVYSGANIPIFQYLNANSTTNDQTLRQILSWGDLNVAHYQFSNCVQLTSVPIDAPRTTTDYSSMFSGCVLFNSYMAEWDVSAATDMSNMFAGATSFNQNISAWNTGGVISMTGMFSGASVFNNNIESWDVSNVTTMSNMFAGATSFNRPIGAWNTTSLTDMVSMFAGATSFNQDLTNWDISGVSSLDSVFSGATVFNGDVSTWNVSNVTTMSNMFAGAASFNQSLTGWVTSAVLDFSSMFRGALSFTGSGLDWNTSSAVTMANMFDNAINFTGQIGSWDTANVTNMSSMFSGATSFNSDISNWVVGSVTDMTAMFYESVSFNQQLKWWCVSEITQTPIDFSIGSSLVSENLPKWGLCPIRDTLLTINGLPPYLTVGDSRTLSYDITPTQPVQSVAWFTDNQSVAVIDQNSGEYILLTEGIATFTLVVNGIYTASVTFTVNSSIQPFTFTSLSNSTISVNNPTAAEVVIDWGDGSRIITSEIINNHTYTDGVMHNVKVSAPSVSLPPLTVSGGIEEVISWYGGLQPSIKFGSDSNLTYLTTLPNLPPDGWDDAAYMFLNCQFFNQDISMWDVSYITSMAGMFKGASAFNQNISAWNVTSVTDMSEMFYNASNFNQDLVLWCVSGVIEPPLDFATGAVSFDVDYLPVWGTCPNRNVVVSLNAAKTTIGIDLREYVTYAIDPSIPVEEVIWSVDDPQIFSITSTGLVTAKALGSATISIKINKSYRAKLRLTATETSFDASVMVFEITRTTSSVVTEFPGGVGLPATIDWGDGIIEEVTSQAAITHSYPDGAFTNKAYIQILPTARSKLNISGDFSRVLQWSSLGYEQLTLGNNTTGSPYLLDVPQIAPPLLEDYSNMFLNCTTFNDDIAGWNTANVTNMSNMFKGCTVFNGNLSTWNVSSVTNMAGTFQGAAAFNSDISGWDMSNVTDMSYMFSGATLFNSNIVNWNVGAVSNMDYMFQSANAFDHDLSWWCVSNVTTLPVGFNENVTLFTEVEFPVWGTCPSYVYNLVIDNPGDVKTGKTTQLNYSLTPPTTVVYETWTSADETIATVDANGVVTGVNPGTVLISLVINKVYVSSINVNVILNVEINSPTNLNLIELAAPENLTGEVI